MVELKALDRLAEWLANKSPRVRPYLYGMIFLIVLFGIVVPAVGLYEMWLGIAH